MTTPHANALLGRRICALREAAEMSQAELAYHLGWHQIAVGELEAGRRPPTLMELRQIAACLGVTILAFDPVVILQEAEEAQ